MLGATARIGHAMMIFTEPTDYLARGLFEALRLDGWKLGCVRTRTALLMIASKGGERRIVRMLGDDADDRLCATSLARGCGLANY